MKNLFFPLIALIALFASCSNTASNSIVNEVFKKKFERCQAKSGYVLNIETYQFNGTKQQQAEYLRCMKNQ